MTFLGLLASGGGGDGGAMPESAIRLSALAIELPKFVTPVVAGVVVGVFVAVVGCAIVLLLASRPRRPRRIYEPAVGVVHVPPYPTFSRVTPLPPARAFAPSSELSARAFAKMHSIVDEDELAPAPYAAPERGERERDGSQPHPLGIIPASSAAMRSATPALPSPSAAPMRPASMAEFDVDDSPTEIAETIFDEPPQPRRRSDPPRIRQVAPAPPRHAAPVMTTPTPMLPAVTPPMPRTRPL